MNLFLLAHPDDEFFILPIFSALRECGEDCFIIYLTDGESSGTELPTRAATSLQLIKDWGVPEEKVLFLGTNENIKALTLFQSTSKCYERVLEFLEKEQCQASRTPSKYLSIDRIISHAWEGGHPDHDAAHLIALRLAKFLKIEREFYEFSSYHLCNRRYPLLNCMSLLPAGKPDKYFPLGQSLSLKEAFSWAYAYLTYVRQRKISLVPGPFVPFTFLFRRRVLLRQVPERDYWLSPHTGKLLSEDRFNVPFEKFLSYTASFLEQVK